MPGPPVLVSGPRGGLVQPTRIALRAEGREAKSFWRPRAELAGFELELEASPDDGRGEASVAASVRNATGGPQRLDAVDLSLQWVGAAPRVADTLHYGAVALAGEPSDGSRALVGVAASDRCLARVGVEARGGRGAEFTVELRADAVLEAGERRVLDPVSVALGEDGSAMLESFAERWGRDCGARTWRPALLTCWLGAPGAATLPQALEAMSALRETLPVEAVLLREDFEGSLEKAAEAVRAAGFVAGLGVAPLLAEGRREGRAPPSDWLLQYDDHDWPDKLDSSRDEVLDHLEARFRELHEQGFFLYALLGLDPQPGSHAADRRIGPAARMRRALEAVRRGASDEAFLLTESAWDSAPWGPAVGVVDARRADWPRGLDAWTHRRLWISAADTPCAAAAGAMLVLEGSPAALAPEERERWAEAALRARRADEGIPGAARLVDPLAREPQLAADPAPDAPPLAVFCDFDGTFSVQDVGATLAQRHGGERRPREWARYERGEITPWDYNLEILDGLPVGTEVLEDFLAGVELDPGAEGLLDWCGLRGVPFRILSDGFDWNLNRLQALHGVRFAYTANHLRIEHGRWRIAAGAPDPDCGCGTGTCKAAALRAFRARHPGAHLVHIGNGRVSDSCGAVEADTAFAKDSLAEALARRGEPFVPFETLRDVIPHLERILDAAPRALAPTGC